MRMIGAILSVLATVGSVMASSPPAGAFTIGVSTENQGSFSSPYWQALGIRRTRYIAAWDAVEHPDQRAVLDSFLRTARAQGIEVLVAFSRGRGSECPNSPCSAPSLPRYTTAMKAFHRRYPWVKLIQPWNEINNPTQPTYHRPELAAAYYQAVRRICPRCTVPAADLQDVNNFASYLRRFLRALHGRRPTLWGLHNYSSINRFRSDGTKLALKLLPGRIWLTETGGIYTFRSGNVIVFPPSANRSARATSYMMQTTLRYRSRLQRLYIYEWDADTTGHFDAGLVDPAGKPRQSYTILQKYRRFIL